MSLSPISRARSAGIATMVALVAYAIFHSFDRNRDFHIPAAEIDASYNFV